MADINLNKVLIITYYWPPAGGPGVQRVLKFAKYLPKFGWEPIILTVENGEFPAIDESLLSQIPGHLKIYKTKTLEPFSIYKRLLRKKKEEKIDTYILNQKNAGWSQRVMNWIRMNLFIPDARVGWYSYAVNMGCEIVENENIDLIYSCSPPHSLQLIARSIAAKTNKKWVADFRDPWSAIVSYQGQNRNKITKYLDHKLERKVLLSADKIVVTCRGLKEDFEKGFQIDGNKIHVITNGYDEVSPINHKVKNDGVFKIFYAGNLSSVRIPHALIKALNLLKSESLNSSVQFVIAGHANQEFWDLAEQYEVTDLIDFKGYVSHQEVLEEYSKADLLLLVVDQVPANHLFIAGKLFDYLGSKKPIIAFGPKGGEVNEIIDQTNSGYFFNYEEVDMVVNALKESISNKSSKTRKFSFRGIEIYKREALTERLSIVMNELL